MLMSARTGKPVLGVLPYLNGLHLEAEDAVARHQRDTSAARLRVLVPLLRLIIDDPLGVEGDPGRSPGLGLLDLETRLEGRKRLINTSGRLCLSNAPVSGYEIHAGATTGPASPMRKNSGAVTRCERGAGKALVCMMFLHECCDPAADAEIIGPIAEKQAHGQEKMPCAD